MRTTAGILITVALALGACGDDDGTSSDDSHPAVEALERQIGYLSDGQTGRAYDELHPAQQEFITRDLYMTCTTDVVELVDLEVKEVFEEVVTIPGTDEEVDSVAITAEITVRSGAGEQSDTTTFHEVEVDGEWRFSVTGVDAWQDGECP